MALSWGGSAGSPGLLLLRGPPPCGDFGRTPLPAISISAVKAPIAPIVHITARPKVVNSTDATVVSRKAPTNRVRTDAQVAAPPKAARRTAASSARDRRFAMTEPRGTRNPWDTSPARGRPARLG